jgi:hypothetical protein
VTSLDPHVFPLEAIRTDGWFERVSASIGSFDVLCDILGEAFVAFSLISGARVTALTIDRRRPGETLVDFDVGDGSTSQRLTLDEFRQRLTNALCSPDPTGPAPSRREDSQGIQLHIGARYLLLAPLFGYRLDELHVGEKGSFVVLQHDDRRDVVSLDDLQELLRSHVMQEFYRVDEAQEERNAGIDLTLVEKAEQASAAGKTAEVVTMLGGWMVPLTILLRTPDGARLDPDSRTKLSRALGLLGSALAVQSEPIEALAALRLSVQYALGTPHAGAAYARMGRVLMAEGRFGEAIAPLRRSVNLGGPEEVAWPGLARSFLESGRLLAALGAVLEAEGAGIADSDLGAVRARVFAALPALRNWEELFASGAPPEG